MPADRPNILIITTDQQRADSLGCASHPQLRTPHTDRLAAEGVHLTRAVTVSPLCMASRISFLTGQYPHNHQVWWNRGEVADSEVSLFRLLQGGGYSTAHIGKGHYCSFRGEGSRAARSDRDRYMHGLGFDYVHEIYGNGAIHRRTPT
jgi:arylsulfatase